MLDQLLLLIVRKVGYVGLEDVLGKLIFSAVPEIEVEVPYALIQLVYVNLIYLLVG